MKQTNPRPPSASPERTRARKTAQRRAQALFLKQYGVSTAEALVSRIIRGEIEICETLQNKSK